MDDNARKQELVDRISSMIVGRNEKSASVPEQSDGFEKQAELLRTAGKMLKYAAKRTHDLEYENECLAAENQRLSDRLLLEQRKNKAEKLASLMRSKGLIKSSTIDEKTAELTLMDDTGFDILKTAVENIHIDKSASYQGIDNLTFLSAELNMNSEDVKNKTFVETIADM